MGAAGVSGAGGAGGAARRASERDLPARLAAEAGVKCSKSTPALHHAPPDAHHHTPVRYATSCIRLSLKHALNAHYGNEHITS